MQFSQGLSDLWELLGETFGEVTRDLHKLQGLVQRNPQFWTWLTVWLALVWICLRWSKKVAEANDRRIFQAAEARLSQLMENAKTESIPDEPSAFPANAASSTENTAQSTSETGENDQHPQEAQANGDEGLADTGEYFALPLSLPSPTRPTAALGHSTQNVESSEGV